MTTIKTPGFRGNKRNEMTKGKKPKGKTSRKPLRKAAKPSRTEEARKVVTEYAETQRGFAKRLRDKLH